jgi:hypothetical protein
MAKQYIRRTFNEVADEAFEQGFNKGVIVGTFRQKADLDRMHEELEALKSTVANMSLSKLAWSRLTNIFKQGN